ncbi:MAG TPA: nuclear transport factor 2 family protein [Kofleriaceae bacterium]|nr:nuclear transport factor 2 family protein [Kofleriaceae bacterium]
MRLLVLCAVTAACGGASPGASAPVVSSPAAAAQAAVEHLVAAFNAHDVAAVHAQLTGDAHVSVIGEGGPRAIDAPLAALLARFPDSRLRLGRLWLDPPAAVVELGFRATATPGPLFSATIDARPISVASAAIFRVTSDGRIADIKLYVDFVNALGQLAPSLLPAGTQLRPPEPDPQPAVIVAEHSSDEAANLAATNAVWDALTAHDAARALASAAETYRYVDFAAPDVLDKPATERMVDGFLTAVTDFRIADKPTQLAAGPDVLTDVTEHAELAARPITLHALDIKRFANGQVVQEWQYSNYLEVLTQTGRMKPLAILPAGP